MHTRFLAIAALAAGTLFGQVSVNINLGPPPPPRFVNVRPAMPGQGYSWVDGYWYPEQNRYNWRDGYWARPPYRGANWIAPRYDGNRYYAGRWYKNRGQAVRARNMVQKDQRQFEKRVAKDYKDDLKEARKDARRGR